MKPILALLAILALAHCKSTSRLPPPGEPVSKDLDERWTALKEARERADGDLPVPYADPDDQKAYEAGYAAGYLDHSRQRPSDPGPHMEGIAERHHSAFSAGYTAGFAR